MFAENSKDDNTFENNEMAKFFEQLGLSDKKSVSTVTSDAKTSPQKHTLVSRRKYIIFEGCVSKYDQISFVPYTGEVQSTHNDIKKHTKRAKLNLNPKRQMKIDMHLFRESFLNEIFALREHSKRWNEQDFKSIELSLVIKLGFEYFFSRFFRWNNTITIDELNQLSDIKQIPSTNHKYYVKPKFEPRDEFFGTLQSSFTDHESIDETKDFNTFIVVSGFEAIKKNIITYRLIITNRYSLMKNLLNELAIDERVKKILIEAKQVLLKFDCDFKLREIDLSDESKLSNIDVVRVHDVSDEQKFDTRVKMRAEASINKDSFKQFNKLRQVFKDFIEVSEDEKIIRIKCGKDDIRFLRKINLTIYKDQNQESLFDLRTNSFIEYKQISSTSDSSSQHFEPSIHVKSHIKMKTSLVTIINQIPSDFVTNERNNNLMYRFCEELWLKSLWLSNISSNFKKFSK